MTINMKRQAIAAAAMLLLLAIAAPAFAVGALADSPYEQQILQARYDLVSARVTFTAGVLSDTASLVANASGLMAHVNELNGDLNTLKGFVDANDREGFNGCVSGTISPDMKDAHDALKANIRQFKAWGVSGETIKQLREDYANRKSTFEQQTDAAIIELGNIRLGYYNDVMSKADARMSEMSAKGIDVSGMQEVKAGAEANVISPLQSAINSQDAGAVKQQLAGKCLGNGAPYSYHFFAKIDLEALKGISAKIEASVNNSTIREQLAAVNQRLASAGDTLNVVGTMPYTADQQSQVWDNLKAASEGLKEIIKELNGRNAQG